MQLKICRKYRSFPRYWTLALQPSGADYGPMGLIACHKGSVLSAGHQSNGYIRFRV